MMKSLKNTLLQINSILLFLGINITNIVKLRLFPFYLYQYLYFYYCGGRNTSFYPILNNLNENAGVAKGHYFHQDLLVASYIYNRNPTRHIDVGSRIDGFISHLACFRSVEIFDVRKLEEISYQNIKFVRKNLIETHNIETNITDSISCLHAIEHFGLGRYGDPIDPVGHIKGFNNLLTMLKKDGILYISFPIGVSNKVYFNAHRIFRPDDIFNWAYEKNSILLLRFDYVDDAGNVHKDIDLAKCNINSKYGCGIYTFKKII